MNQEQRAIIELDRIMPPGSKKTAREVISELANLGFRQLANGRAIAPNCVVEARKHLGIKTSLAKRVNGDPAIWWWTRENTYPQNH